MPAARHFCVLLGVLAAALLCAVAPASAAEKGVVTDMTWGVSPADQERAAGFLADSQAGWVRLNVSWYWYDLYPVEMQEKIDRAVDLARAAGSKVLLMVNHAPARFSGSLNIDAPPQDAADYARFIREFAPHFAARVDAWEIWNEPNHPEFWPTAGGPNAAEYVKLLKAGSDAVRDVDPTANVLFGGVAYNDYKFLEAAYAADPDIGDHFDTMAVHPYTGPFDTGPEQVTTAGDGRMTTTSFPAYREVRDVLTSYGDTKPIWFTEFGWSSSTLPGMGVGEATQAEYLTRAYEFVEQDPYVEVAIAYCLRNSYWALDANTWLDQLGLLRTDYSAKPAYAAFKAYEPPAPSATPQPQPVEPASSAPVTPVATLPARELPRTSAPLTPAASARPEITLRVERGSSAITRAAAASTSTRVARRGGRDMWATGIVRGATGGSVQVRLQRRAANGKWKHVRSLRAKVNAGGAFAAGLKVRSGRWRVTARYAGNNGNASSSRTFAVAPR